VKKNGKSSCPEVCAKASNIKLTKIFVNFLDRLWSKATIN